MDEHSYSEREMKQIIEHALKMQQKTKTPRVPTDEHSLSDIIEISRDLGISEEMIRQAAHDLDSGKRQSLAKKLLGDDLQQTHRLVLDYPAEMEKLEQLAVELSKITRISGNVSMIGKTLLWQSDYKARQEQSWNLSISVSVKKEKTIIEIENQNTMLAGGLFGGLGGGVGLGAGFGVGLGVGLGALGSAAFSILFPIGVLCGSLAMARKIFVLVSKHRRKKLDQILNKIKEVLQPDSQP
jgi:hypothetical protein